MKRAILGLSLAITLMVAGNDGKDFYYVIGADPSSLNAREIAKRYGIVEIDGSDATEKDIAGLHSAGLEVICYMSAGTAEKWRNDFSRIPHDAIGEKVDGWDGEYWLDVRNPSVSSAMRRRVAEFRSKGCDGVEFDNVDGYDNETGFPLTYRDQLKYNGALADYAHSLGMKTVLKNDVEQLNDLFEKFDYAINEECRKYKECSAYKNWIDGGKPVFDIEYSKRFLKRDSFKSPLFKTYLANLDLDGKRYEKIDSKSNERVSSFDRRKMKKIALRWIKKHHPNASIGYRILWRESFTKPDFLLLNPGSDYEIVGVYVAEGGPENTLRKLERALSNMSGIYVVMKRGDELGKLLKRDLPEVGRIVVDGDEVVETSDYK